jgi:hypothetical protein
MYYSNIRIITFLKITTVTTLALGSRLRQGLAKAWAKRETQESHFMLPRVLPLWELESWWTPKFLESDCRGQTYWIEECIISLESSWNIMSKMGSHDPFGHLIDKLWPKDRPGVKLAI